MTLPTRRAAFFCRVSSAFTLIELLVVIAIIAILAGLAFPVLSGMMDRAKKVQAKNDLTQIIVAVQAFYTDYAQYPIPSQGAEYTYDGTSNKTDKLFNDLRGNNYAEHNPRRIAFVTFPDVKDNSQPRAGIGGDGQFYDPWGSPYRIRIDGDYDNTVGNPYDHNSGAGSGQLRTASIAWSLGTNLKGGTGKKTSADSSDDVISWQ